MTLAEFSQYLTRVQVGEGALVPYAIYEQLFPPGEPDIGARERAGKFAAANQMEIANHPDAEVVVFFREKPFKDHANAFHDIEIRSWPLG